MSSGKNPTGENGSYIVYVRSGTYTRLDRDRAFLALRGPYGSESRRKGLTAYPGEMPTLDARNAGRGVVWNAKYDPYGLNSYITVSKLHVINGWWAFEIFGDNNRVIGNHMQDMLKQMRSGVVMVDNSKDIAIYGNCFDPDPPQAKGPRSAAQEPAFDESHREHVLDGSQFRAQHQTLSEQQNAPALARRGATALRTPVPTSQGLRIH